MSHLRILIVSVLIFSASAAAESSKASQKLEHICSEYRAKTPNVPVYKQPDKTSKVIARLALGEKVCHVGEQKGFAIIDWSWQEEVNERGEREEGERSRLVFVRLTDLWAPPPATPKDAMQQMKDYFFYMRQGGVPDDILTPFYPLLDKFGYEPTCKAGAICEKLDSQQKTEREKQP